MAPAIDFNLTMRHWREVRSQDIIEALDGPPTVSAAECRLTPPYPRALLGWFPETNVRYSQYPWLLLLPPAYDIMPWHYTDYNPNNYYCDLVDIRDTSGQPTNQPFLVRQVYNVQAGTPKEYRVAVLYPFEELWQRPLKSWNGS